MCTSANLYHVEILTIIETFVRSLNALRYKEFREQNVEELANGTLKWIFSNALFRPLEFSK